eukprot:m.146999 g.146999  ORF g.146999 m.146999 type:complete len:629 (-) comp17273_c1_seq2:159-2045(-)
MAASLVVVQYNMLEASLASAAVPWLFQIPKRLKARLANHDHVVERVRSEYLTHWHKNGATGKHYGLFRRLFSVDVVDADCQALVEAKANGLEGVTLRGSNRFAYGTGSTSVVTEALTLAGVLRHTVRAKARTATGHSQPTAAPTTSHTDTKVENLPKTQQQLPPEQPLDAAAIQLANDIFAYVADRNATVLGWPVRGPRILDLITNQGPVCERFFGPVELASGEGPHVVVIEEYDCHMPSVNAPALCYAQSGGGGGDRVKQRVKQRQGESEGDNRHAPVGFADALRSRGYHVTLFEAPRLNGHGICVAVRADTLQPSGWKVAATKQPATADGGTDGATAGGRNHEELLLGTVSPAHTLAESCFRAQSVDLHELYHPVPGKHAAEQEVPAPLEQPPGQRRSVGMGAFEFVPGHALEGQSVVILAAHLMTASRDNASKVLFPGEVRSGELERIRKLTSEFVRPTDAVLFCGDLNCELDRDAHVFEGCVPATPGKCSGEVLPQCFVTGYDAAQHAFSWQRTNGTSLVLANAFAAPAEGEATKEEEDDDDDGCVDGCGASGASTSDGTLAGCHGTSRNIDRVATIDYVWYDRESFRVLSRSPLEVAGEPMPTLQHPSDHIPLVARLEVVSTS